MKDNGHSHILHSTTEEWLLRMVDYKLINQSIFNAYNYVTSMRKLGLRTQNTPIHITVTTYVSFLLFKIFESYKLHEIPY